MAPGSFASRLAMGPMTRESLSETSVSVGSSSSSHSMILIARARVHLSVIVFFRESSSSLKFSRCSISALRAARSARSSGRARSRNARSQSAGLGSIALADRSSAAGSRLQSSWERRNRRGWGSSFEPTSWRSLRPVGRTARTECVACASDRERRGCCVLRRPPGSRPCARASLHQDLTLE